MARLIRKILEGTAYGRRASNVASGIDVVGDIADLA